MKKRNIKKEGKNMKKEKSKEECNCFMCMTDEIWRTLNKVYNIDETFGETRGMFIGFLLFTCLGAIRGESSKEMLEKVNELDFIMHNFEDVLKIEIMEETELEMDNFEEMVSFKEKTLADRFVNENMEELTLKELD